jgi:hypothetical protein
VDEQLVGFWISGEYLFDSPMQLFGLIFDPLELRKSIEANASDSGGLRTV